MIYTMLLLNINIMYCTCINDLYNAPLLNKILCTVHVSMIYTMLLLNINIMYCTCINDLYNAHLLNTNIIMYCIMYQ